MCTMEKNNGSTSLENEIIELKEARARDQEERARDQEARAKQEEVQRIFLTF